jgi:hypothetical protein
VEIFSEKLFKELGKARVRYLVVGGVACVLHGVVRLTRDVDLFVDLKESNLKKFIKIMSRLGYKPKAPVDPMDFADPKKRKEWKKTKNMLVFSFYHPSRHMELIDIFVYEPIKFESAHKGRKVFSAKKIRIPAISIADLKRLKRLSGRPQDLADVKVLEELEKMGGKAGSKTKKS